MSNRQRSTKMVRVRNLDEESGKDRTRSRRRDAPPRYSVDTEDESDSPGSQTDSETEKFLQKKQKDDSRAPKPKRKPKDQRIRSVRPTDEPEEAGAEDVEEVKKPEPATTASHALLLTAMSYRMGFIKRDYPHINQYFPDVTTMFDILGEMTTVISSNSLLHEVFPAYTSVALHLYYGHVVFYHILRVREDNGRLGRIERRCLRAYQQIGPPESWPVATPLIGYIQALGAVIIEGGKYGRILPALPDYSNLKADHGLQGIEAVQGSARLPIIPALTQFLYNYAQKLTHFDDDDGFLYPTKAKKLADADGKRFVGLISSAADAKDFQALTYSSSWFLPNEQETDTFMMNTAQKQGIVRRWGIRPFGDGSTIQELDKFLGLNDDMEPSWLKNLLVCAEEANKFFPGSVNLSTIPLHTRVENVSLITISSKSGKDAVLKGADTWYTTRKNWRIKLSGTTIREDAQIAYQMASSIMIRTTYKASVIPATIANAFAERTFHAEEDNFFHPDTAPREEMYCEEMTDPFELALQLIEGKMYDKFGGRNH